MCINNPQDRPQILAVVLSCLIVISCGALHAWPSPSIPKLISDESTLKLSLTEASYLTVIGPLTALIAAFPYSNIVNKFGRKNCLLFISIPYTISWILIANATSLWILYVSRLLAGIGDAGIYSTVPIYVGEITTPKIRGSWGNSMTLFLFIGALMMNIIGAYCSITMTAYTFMGISIICFLFFILMPETPYFLIMKSRLNEAKISLRWLRGNEDVDDEFNQISNALSVLSESGSFRDLFIIGSNRKAILVAIITRFTQQFSGISAFSVYSQYLFKVAGGNISSSISAIICSSVMVAASIVASILLNTLGRRKAIFVSAIGCNIILILMGTFLYIKLKTCINLNAFLWFPVAGMILFIILFSLRLGVVPTLMLGELFSSSIKGKALALMNVMYGLYVAGTTKIFQMLLSAYGLYSPFIFYAVCCCAGTIACYFIVPETKGKTLEEIQQYFETKEGKIYNVTSKVITDIEKF